MRIKVSEKQREHIKTQLLPKLAAQQIEDLIRLLEQIEPCPRKRSPTQSEIASELQAAAKDLRKYIRRMDGLRDKGGQASEELLDLSYQFTGRTKDDYLVSPVLQIAEHIESHVADMASRLKSGRPAATDHIHTLLGVITWFDYSQSAYRVSASRESPFAVFAAYLLTDLLQIGIQDPARHVSRAVAHYKKRFDRHHKTPAK